MSEFSIVFMGTPEFAVAILDRIYEDGIKIKAVVTAPDKPAGRGRNLNESAVKKSALSKGLTILQPTNLKEPSFIQSLSELQADLFVVVAFRMLPEVVWAMPAKGTINLHASLLPNYRGAAPINWAIINGENKTGVTTFYIEKEIDTGAIIEQAETTIGNNETVGELYGRLMEMGANLVSSTIKKIQSDTVKGIPQDEVDQSDLNEAPKIFKSDCEIDFGQDVNTVHNFCRGLSPYPAAWCALYNRSKEESKTYKVLSTATTSISVADKSELKADKDGLLIPCSDYYIRVLELQPEGKRRMNYQEFLAGNPFQDLLLKE